MFCTFRTDIGIFDLSSIANVKLNDNNWIYSVSPCASFVPLLLNTQLCLDKGAGPAFQVTHSVCLSLGMLESRRVAPLQYPQLGISISYWNGDENRRVTLNITCSDNIPYKIFLQTNVGHLHYLLIVQARQGCPISCGRDKISGAVCGGIVRGMCLSDQDSYAYCKCRDGFGGHVCSSQTHAINFKTARFEQLSYFRVFIAVAIITILLIKKNIYRVLLFSLGPLCLFFFLTNFSQASIEINTDYAVTQLEIDCWTNVSIGSWEKYNGSHYSIPFCGISTECGSLEERALSLSYFWKPGTQCSLLPAFESLSLCNMKTGDIFLVGDSLSWFFSLTLRGGVHACGQSENVFLYYCPSSPIQFTFIRSDILSVSNISFHDKSLNILHDSWFDRLLASPTVRTLLLNRGAHYVDDDTLLKELELTLSAVSKARPDVLVFYRSTPAGHSDCGLHQHDIPLKLGENFKQDTSIYHWGQFKQQNFLTRSLILTSFQKILYIDVASLTDLRRDSHIGAHDCLHYCIPGPVDTWVELFGGALHLAFVKKLRAP